MRIDWMTKAELNEAIPPAYTEYLGRQIIDYLTMADDEPVKLRVNA
jgi:DNA (cytosine-5)-methyltransferase 1